MQGTQQAVIESVMTATPPRISAPTARAHYAWDPDIPVTQQQIRFEAKGVEALPIVWRINKHVVSRAAIFIGNLINLVGCRLIYFMRIHFKYWIQFLSLYKNDLI